MRDAHCRLFSVVYFLERSSSCDFVDRSFYFRRGITIHEMITNHPNYTNWGCPLYELDGS